MKKILLFIALCVATLTASAQNTVKTLTFEDLGTSTYWADLIDDPQYFGPLLYSQDPNYIYQWCDTTTRLRSAIPENYGQHWYWGGGHAISDYWSGLLSRGNYQNQLEVYVPGNNSYGRGGHGYNGSDHFAVHFGYIDGSQFNMTDTLPYFEFYDNVPRRINSMKMNITTYLANVLLNGNSLSPSLGASDTIWVKAIGYKANGNKVTQKFTIATGSTPLVTGWRNWNLIALGDVVKVEFNIGGNTVNKDGFSLPAYFCYDNVEVRFPTSTNIAPARKEIKLSKERTQGEEHRLEVNLMDMYLGGDVPEGCNYSFETDNENEVCLDPGEKHKVTVSGLPKNAKITKIVENAWVDESNGAVTTRIAVGDEEISEFKWGGGQANHGYVCQGNGDADAMEITMYENSPVIQDNNLYITSECHSSMAIFVSYEIFYTLESADDEPAVATFEDFALETESYWAGDEEGDDWYYGLGYQQRFKSGQYSFVNYCIPDYQTWIGYAVSNQTSTDFSSLDDQFKSCVGSGVNGSANYCVAYPDGTMWGETLSIEVEGGARVVPGFYITNSAYVVNSITKGDSFAGDPFTVGDYFKVTIHALDADGNETATRDFCLADYRFEQEADRYYISDWTYVDLSQLGAAAAFTFTFEASRKNNYGPLTPTYFCIDDFGAEGKETVREEGTYNGDVDGIQTVTYETRPVGIFTIDGRRVNSTTKPGLYIINGRKVMVK